MMRIREIGLRSMTPARIYDLAMEVSEQSYREVAADTAHEMRNIRAELLRRIGLTDLLTPRDFTLQSSSAA